MYVVQKYNCSITRDYVFEDNYLNEAQMNGAQMNGAQMNGAQMNGAQMNGTQMNGALMTGAQINGAQINGTPNGTQIFCWGLPLPTQTFTQQGPFLFHDNDSWCWLIIIEVSHHLHLFSPMFKCTRTTPASL